MITEEILLAAGYRRYTDSFSNADWLYQKRIRDVNGDTSYFINLYYYKFAARNSWELSMTFDRHDPLFNRIEVRIPVSEERTIEDVEAIASRIFVLMEGSPYDD